MSRVRAPLLRVRVRVLVHKREEFVDQILKRYFLSTKWISFVRQLNLYGFIRLTHGLDNSGYYHEKFLRGKVSLAYDIKRMKLKGNRVRAPNPDPDDEPNFYAMPPVEDVKGGNKAANTDAIDSKECNAEEAQLSSEIHKILAQRQA